jgi:hypothetical protein
MDKKAEGVNQRDELIIPVCKYALVIGVSDYKNA